MNGTNMNIKVDVNGAMTLTNDRSTITIYADGTIAVSSLDPIQLTGNTQLKFDEAGMSSLTLHSFNEALLTRTKNKKR